jgi:sugar phosphate isomerase/epimerase
MPARLSYQLYCSRLQNRPIEATLAMLAKHGYKEVEGFGGIYGEPKKLKAALDANGLSMPSGHFAIEQLEKKKGETLDIARTLGINQIVIPWLAPESRPKSAKGWKEFGKRLNAIAATYRPEGFGVAWHNHDFEFFKLKDGAIPQALIFANAPLLDWEIDVAWVVKGKANPLKWIKDHAGIITIAHVKDIAPPGQKADEDGWADVGEGTMKWKDYFAALAKTKCMHFVLEHDKPSDDERFAKRSIAACKKY